MMGVVHRWPEDSGGVCAWRSGRGVGAGRHFMVLAPNLAVEPTLKVPTRSGGPLQNRKHRPQGHNRSQNNEISSKPEL